MKMFCVWAAVILTVAVTGTAFADSYVASGTMCREMPSLYTGNLKYSSTKGAYNDGNTALTVFCPAVVQATADTVQDLEVTVCDQGASSYVSVGYYIYDLFGDLYNGSVDDDAHSCTQVVGVSSLAEGYIPGFVVSLPAKNGANVSSVISYKVTEY